MLFFIDQSLITHQKKSYDYENNNKYRQKLKKFIREMREKSVEAIYSTSFSLKALSTVFHTFFPST